MVGGFGTRTKGTRFLRAEASRDILKISVSEMAFPGVFMGYFPLRTSCCLEYAKDWEQCRQNVQEPIRFCGGLTSLPIRLEGSVSVYFQHYKWQNQRGLRRYGSTKKSR